ncbi:hypothetical protein PVAND_001496 [Polypedilum vanderplanki]|uniref:Uncharacterized protein n=1 Tax=Polypedilum vanderplanki TaxID=319348 RepID=A0A9J6BPE9_POLVA|nr:hypothetical protein PVAND_001496 [Polypedilum vanderplanki]
MGEVSFEGTVIERIGPNEPDDLLVIQIENEVHFITFTQLAAERSKIVVNTGACLVDTDRKVIGIGWNGPPKIGDKDDNPLLSHQL